MTFIYSYTYPKTSEEQNVWDQMGILEYAKINHFCKYLGYDGVGDFLRQLNSEFDYTGNLSSEEMLKKSYPYIFRPLFTFFN